MDLHLLCYYCNAPIEGIKSAIGHLCHNHANSELAYRFETTDPASGKRGFKTKRYAGIVPSEITADNKRIEALENGNIVLVEEHSTTTPHARKKRSVQESSPIANDRETGSNSHTESLVRRRIWNDTEVTSSQESATRLEGVDEDTAEPMMQDDDNFDDSGVATDSAFEEIVDLLPRVLHNLRESGQIQSYQKFNRLVADGLFPLKNICFQLFLDIVEWFSAENTSQMRYLYPDTIHFWKVCSKLFKGKFARFMAGPRGLGNVLEDEDVRGKCDPQKAKINFAVPTPKTLRESVHSNDEHLVYPGILHEELDALASKPDTVYKLGIDGKKIARGKGDSMGDIDCWGCEPSPTLQEQKERLSEEMNVLSQCSECTDRIMSRDYKNLQDLPADLRNELLVLLQIAVKNIAKRIQNLRTSKLSLERSFEKFQKIAGDDWRKSRFLFVISSIKTSLYDTEAQIKSGLDIVDDLCLFAATVNDKQLLYTTSHVDLENQGNYHELQADLCNEDALEADVETRYVKQRSDAWFKLRKEALVTGSTCNTAVGLAGLKRQQQHYDETIHGVSRREFSPEQQANMDYGTKHEIDAISTLVSKVLPSFYPDLCFVEEGCMPIRANGFERPLFVVW